MNLAAADSTVDYVNTGNWSKKAIGEAKRYCAHVNVVADAAARGYNSVPAGIDLAAQPGCGVSALHAQRDHRRSGVPVHSRVGDVPLVADYSSSILSAPLDVSRFGVIYAGAQKNIGPSGLVRGHRARRPAGPGAPRDAGDLELAPDGGRGSMSNTPNTFGWYVAGLVFKWLKALGGLAHMAELNQRKARHALLA